MVSYVTMTTTLDLIVLLAEQDLFPAFLEYCDMNFIQLIWPALIDQVLEPDIDSEDDPWDDDDERYYR